MERPVVDVAEQTTAIIRSSGERTDALCKALISREIAEENVFVICERPFERALLKMCDVALDSGNPFTIVVDADLLLRNGAILELVDEMRVASENVFHLQGSIVDKLTLSVRGAGPRLFRTKTLEAMRKLVPEPGTELRPEAHLIQGMVNRGYETVRAGVITALHDYEQFYRDVYRKAFVHGHKHPKMVADVIPGWRQLRDADPDYEFAIRGLWDGLSSRNGLTLDIEKLPTDVGAILDELNLKEKPPLDISEFQNGFVEKTIRSGNWETPQETHLEYLPGYRKRISTVARELYWLRVAPFLAGCVVERFGVWMKRVARGGSDSRPDTSPTE